MTIGKFDLKHGGRLDQRARTMTLYWYWRGKKDATSCYELKVKSLDEAVAKAKHYGLRWFYLGSGDSRVEVR